MFSCEFSEISNNTFYFYLFTNLFNVDNLQILRYYTKLENIIAYHIVNLRHYLLYVKKI